MKICFLVNELAPAGAQTLLLDIVRNTDADDIEYTVCFIEGDDSLASDFENEDVRVVDFGAKFKFDPRTIGRILRFFRHKEFDILHAHLPYSQTLGRVFGRIGGVKHVISTQHNVPTNYHPITGTFERITRRLDSRTIAVSEGIERAFTGSARQYEPNQRDQWCTIYNGVNVSEFNERVMAADTTILESQYAIRDGPIFLSVGRYVPAKAQHDLIAAMNRVVREQSDAQLFIVGWGELADELHQTVANFALENNVTITGRVSNDDLYRFYSCSDAFVSSSVREGLPIAHLEAMAAELPVVATEIPGVEEIIEHGRTGFLAPARSPSELADRMIEVVTADEPFGMNGYERAAAMFDIEDTAAAHVELYRELCGNTPKLNNMPRDRKHI
ncbi:glycosyltransferase family 4 protein [Halococcus thailandensis]|uniref:Glycosyltransferase n=1 Tax=Halococcus thailandensis JCM 13552 TaxID=1227457 RepID=M0N8W6_9EURY|nr:glycosyltransferase family 4 protein [Halococcus thailandensis]EMA54331.1 glycosyltransferase [Halococcus thailandensis JCM 13552]